MGNLVRKIRCLTIDDLVCSFVLRTDLLIKTEEGCGLLVTVEKYEQGDKGFSFEGKVLCIDGKNAEKEQRFSAKLGHDLMGSIVF